MTRLTTMIAIEALPPQAIADDDDSLA